MSLLYPPISSCYSVNKSSNLNGQCIFDRSEQMYFNEYSLNTRAHILLKRLVVINILTFTKLTEIVKIMQSSVKSFFNHSTRNIKLTVVTASYTSCAMRRHYSGQIPHYQIQFDIQNFNYQRSLTKMNQTVGLR